MKFKHFYVIEKDGKVVTEELDLSSPLLVERWGKKEFKPCKEKDLEIKVNALKEKIKLKVKEAK